MLSFLWGVYVSGTGFFQSRLSRLQRSGLRVCYTQNKDPWEELENRSPSRVPRNYPIVVGFSRFYLLDSYFVWLLGDRQVYGATQALLM